MLVITLIGGSFGTLCAYTAVKTSQGFGHDLSACSKRFAEANGALRRINYCVLRLMAGMTPVLTFIQNFAVIAIIYIGGRSIADGIGGMSTGNIMAAVSYVTQVIMSIMTIP